MDTSVTPAPPSRAPIFVWGIIGGLLAAAIPSALAIIVDVGIRQNGGVITTTLPSGPVTDMTFLWLAVVTAVTFFLNLACYFFAGFRAARRVNTIWSVFLPG